MFMPGHSLDGYHVYSSTSSICPVNYKVCFSYGGFESLGNEKVGEGREWGRGRVWTVFFLFLGEIYGKAFAIARRLRSNYTGEGGR